ncbi:MAG TPA: hypothetical protein VGJ14_06700 [Sporichthyaceae bacterium]
MINAIAGNSYVGTAGARLPMAAAVPAAAAAWQLTDAVRPHVMAKQLKRTTDVFPSRFRGMDPPV